MTKLKFLAFTSVFGAHSYFASWSDKWVIYEEGHHVSFSKQEPSSYRSANHEVPPLVGKSVVNN